MDTTDYMMWLDMIELLHPGSKSHTEAPNKFVKLELADFRTLKQTLKTPPPAA